MRRFPRSAILAAGLLLVAAAGSAQQEVTRTEIRKAQVIYVAPNILVVRGKDGIRKFTPENWTNIRVEKDGQMNNPDQLQKGDIVTATIITKTAPRELTAEELKAYAVEGVTTAASGELVSEKVIWTEVRRGQVVYVSPDVLLIKGANGVRKFTPADWKDTKVEKDGRMIAVSIHI
jgi:fructose-specific phosphotransferase system component IIB